MSGRAVWSNLDFEYELAAGQTYKPTPQLQKLCRRWDSILRLLPGCEEAAIGPTPGAETVAWGVAPSVVRALPGQRFCDCTLVRELNDKRFSHRLERELDCALSGARIVDSLESLRAAVLAGRDDWVLKHPLGVGGRERVTGKGGRLDVRAQNWAASRFQEGWTLLFEPWAYSRAEYSFHFEIEEEGPTFLGQCGLVSDESGAFRGNTVSAEVGTDSEIVNTLVLATKRIWEMGYRGPVSVDAFRGLLGEKQVVRPLMEINARYSFGRLALELFRRLPEGWSLFWWHPKARETAEVRDKARDFSGRWEPGVYRLPSFADPTGATGSFLVVKEEG